MNVTVHGQVLGRFHANTSADDFARFEDAGRAAQVDVEQHNSTHHSKTFVTTHKLKRNPTFHIQLSKKPTSQPHFDMFTAFIILTTGNIS